MNPSMSTASSNHLDFAIIGAMKCGTTSLFDFLAAHPGRVFTREQLLRRVLGEHVVLVDRNVDVHVRSIRQKLGEHRTLIETVRGVGYRFQDS